MQLWRKICIGGLLAVGLAADQSETTLQGVLMDKESSWKAETRVAPGPRLEGGMLEAYIHTRQCALMPACQRSGYGVFTYDTYKFLPFDAAGNQRALALLKHAQKEEDFRVEVTGTIQGEVMKVARITLLP